MNTKIHPNRLIFYSILVVSILLNSIFFTFFLGCSQDPSVGNVPHSSKKTRQKNSVTKVHAKHNHSNHEKQRRMGIYHYNEGNKFLRKKRPLEAINNYKMALNHKPDFFEASINLTTAYLQSKKFEEAYKILSSLQNKTKKNHLYYYNLACYYALTFKTDSSFKAIKKAVALGYKNMKKIKSDPDLENLRRYPKFAAWIKDF